MPYDWNPKKMKEHQQLETCQSEKQLLSFFLAQFKIIDPDIVLGHDILEFGLEYLLQRIKIQERVSILHTLNPGDGDRDRKLVILVKIPRG